jgi:hypothetical protein
MVLVLGRVGCTLQSKDEELWIHSRSLLEGDDQRKGEVLSSNKND